jgi:hypothetical protein
MIQTFPAADLKSFIALAAITGLTRAGSGFDRSRM